MKQFIRLFTYLLTLSGGILGTLAAGTLLVKSQLGNAIVVSNHFGAALPVVLAVLLLAYVAMGMAAADSVKHGSGRISRSDVLAAVAFITGSLLLTLAGAPAVVSKAPMGLDTLAQGTCLLVSLTFGLTFFVVALDVFASFISYAVLDTFSRTQGKIARARRIASSS